MKKDKMTYAEIKAKKLWLIIEKTLLESSIEKLTKEIDKLTPKEEKLTKEDYEIWLKRIENHKHTITDFIKLEWEYEVFENFEQWKYVTTIIPKCKWWTSTHNDKYTIPQIYLPPKPLICWML